VSTHLQQSRKPNVENGVAFIHSFTRPSIDFCRHECKAMLSIFQWRRQDSLLVKLRGGDCVRTSIALNATREYTTGLARRNVNANINKISPITLAKLTGSQVFHKLYYKITSQIVKIKRTLLQTHFRKH